MHRHPGRYSDVSPGAVSSPVEAAWLVAERVGHGRGDRGSVHGDWWVAVRAGERWHVTADDWTDELQEPVGEMGEIGEKDERSETGGMNMMAVVVDASMALRGEMVFAMLVEPDWDACASVETRDDHHP